MLLFGPEVEPAPWAAVFGAFAAPPPVVPVPVPVAVPVPAPVPLLGVDVAAAAGGGAVSAIVYNSRVMCCAMALNNSVNSVLAMLVITGGGDGGGKVRQGRSYRAILDAVFAVFAAGHHHRRQDVDEVLLCLHPSSKDVLIYTAVAIRYIPGIYLFDLHYRILLPYYDYLTMDHHHPGMDMGHGGHGGHGDMDMGGGQCNMNVSLLLHIYS